MYKIRYIKASDISGVKHAFETKDIEAADDSAAIAALKQEAASPIEGATAMDVVRGEDYEWEILDSVEL